MERATITINKSFYYSAGKKYGWSPPKWATEGVGVNLEVLQNYKIIQLIVDNVTYLLDSNEAIHFIRRFKSIEDHKGTQVGVVSKSLLKPILDPKNKEDSFPQSEFLQNSLF